jgi:hypothetical protein
VIVNKDATPKKPRVFPEDPTELKPPDRITLDNPGLDNIKLEGERVIFDPAGIGLNNKSAADAGSYARRHDMSCASWGRGPQ